MYNEDWNVPLGAIGLILLLAILLQGARGCATIYREMTTMIVGRSRCLNVKGTSLRGTNVL